MEFNALGVGVGVGPHGGYMDAIYYILILYGRYMDATWTLRGHQPPPSIILWSHKLYGASYRIPSYELCDSVHGRCCDLSQITPNGDLGEAVGGGLVDVGDR